MEILATPRLRLRTADRGDADFYLAPYCGRGYAYEAGMAVLGLAPALGLPRVLAITSPGNVASNGLLRKMGMRFEGVVHLLPEDAGSNLYSLDLA